MHALLRSLTAGLFLLSSPFIAANAVDMEAPLAIEDRFPDLIGKPASLIDVLSQINSRTPVTDAQQIPDSPFLQIVNNAGEVFYLDETGRHLFVGGDLIDLLSGRNLTGDKKAALNRIAWDDLPWELSFSNGIESDRYKIAVFTDVDCPYCARLERLLATAPDLEVHYFVNPLASIHPGAVAVSEQVLCSASPVNAMRSYMLSGELPDVEVTDTCREMVAESMAFSQRHNIDSTPTLVLQTGERILGAPENYMDIKEKIDSLNLN